MFPKKKEHFEEQYTHDFKMFHPALPLTPFIPTLSNVYHQPTHQPTSTNPHLSQMTLH